MSICYVKYRREQGRGWGKDEVKEMEGQNSTAGRSKRSWEGQRWYRQRGAVAAHYTHSQQQLCPRSPESHSDVESSPSHIWEFFFPGCLAEPGQGKQESQGRALTFSSCTPQLDVPKQFELPVCQDCQQCQPFIPAPRGRISWLSKHIWEVWAVFTVTSQ